MTYQEYMLVAISAKRSHPEWRWGQTYFNELYRINPELAEQVRGTNVDPFYRDAAIQPFLDYLIRYAEAFGTLVDERYLID